MVRIDMPHVVVLLPGITGSVLRKHGEVVWGYSAGTLVKSLFTKGDYIRKALALPHDDPTREDLSDGITADELVPDLHLLPGIWKIDGYTKIAAAIKQTFNVTEGYNFFRFPYDWRRYNSVAARKLARLTHDWLSAWRASGHPDAKLVLVAHSMGGLVARYFLECMEGWKDTRALVTFGTPYRGSLNALDGIANGLKKGPLDLTELARELTGLYELLPMFECYDPGNGKLVRVGETSGIPNVNADKAAESLRFYREIESAVVSNSKEPKYQKEFAIFPCVGISQVTNLSAVRDGSSVRMLTTYESKDFGGDGTVPYVSAIPYEMSDKRSAMYAATQHGSLQNADAVIANLTGILAGLDLDLGVFHKDDEVPPVVKNHVALEVDDVYLASEPISIQARPKFEAPLTVTVRQQGQLQPVLTAAMRPSIDEWQVADIVYQPPGVYRVTISGTNVEPAEDSFVVTEAAHP
ncbi:MAG TPA: hypothetical protein VNO35_24635 [Steroidobacteraceae bacterium]|nr:hypothetical protein [Steroidobacteraceae bacterium]